MRMQSIARHIRNNLIRVGLSDTVHDVAMRATNRLLLFRLLRCVVVEKVRPEFTSCPPPYRAQFLTPAMLREFSRDPRYEMSEAFLDEALAKGDQCLGILEGRRLASYSWYSSGPTRISPPDLVMHPGQRWIYMYKGLTQVGDRGRRLYAINLTLATKEFQSQGFRGLVCYIESNNFPSLRSVAWVGSNVGTIYVLGAFGNYHIRSTAGCRERLRVEPAPPGIMMPVGSHAGGSRR